MVNGMFFPGGRTVTKPIRFYVRPVYHGSELLVEIADDHRVDGFPDLAGILRHELGAGREPHPEGMDRPVIALLHQRFFSYWTYAGGAYEIDDDTWGLFVTATQNHAAVIADIERALLRTGQFVKEEVDFARYR